MFASKWTTIFHCCKKDIGNINNLNLGERHVRGKAANAVAHNMQANKVTVQNNLNKRIGGIK